MFSKRKTPYIEQMEHSECGLACMAMILNYYNYKITLTEIREQFGTGKKGTSFSNLVDISGFYNLDAKVYKVDNLNQQLISYPSIVFWENKHYVVLEKVSKDNKKFKVIDPAHGKTIISNKEFYEKYSGYLMMFSLNSNFTPREKVSKANFLWSHITKQKKVLSFVLLTSFILQGFGVFIPKVTQWITDNVILRSQTNYINAIGFIVLTIYIIYQVFYILRGYLIARLQTLIDSSLMSAFISKLFNLPYSFFETRTSGDLIYRANSNTFIRQILSSRVIALVIDSSLVIGYAAMMFFIKWELLLIVLVLSMLILTSMLLSTKLIRNLASKNVVIQTKTQSYLTESIQGICDVKVLGAEKNIFKNWSSLFNQQLMVSQKQSFITSTLESFGLGIQFITPLFLLWIGSSMVISGSMTLGELLAFSTLAVSFIVPIVSMGTTYSQLLLLGSYMQRLQDVMDSKGEHVNAEEIQDFKGHIELKDVSFKYDYFGKNVLNSISLTITPGEKLAIVGASGSGKSSLVKLLLGLNLPTEGSLRYDGKDIKNISIKSVRNNIGAVLQETRLFHGNILDNIELLNEDKSLKKVIEVAKIANIHDDILKQPMGYYTMISEGGSNFSGGQRQRLLLARALIKRPKVLILDEATSALDNISEEIIKNNLENLKCTQVIIAHRLSTVVNADRILVMNEGSIIESGTHEQLINNKGYYYNLYYLEREKNNEEVSV
ncbi:peptidase domain-containing ABC transporter [Priestia flexa]|uniref:peptidase domain-containing ABC transporter n=1 Tax=Priestia flexa TaxID=86664 RepID=UPI0009547937|nr:peptidase domain-containing ABC transporter [Priestia flexa]SIQ61534.1 ABC-type bacteriocin/lantibiotic exporter, contains an N-terminal double-glycine peptidase domain [Priestia flexa]